MTKCFPVVLHLMCTSTIIWGLNNYKNLVFFPSLLSSEHTHNSHKHKCPIRHIKVVWSLVVSRKRSHAKTLSRRSPGLLMRGPLFVHHRYYFLPLRQSVTSKGNYRVVPAIQNILKANVASSVILWIMDT